jgi:hypothetical protein
VGEVCRRWRRLALSLLLSLVPGFASGADAGGSELGMLLVGEVGFFAFEVSWPGPRGMMCEVVKQVHLQKTGAAGGTRLALLVVREARVLCWE